jgi:release factor glutamine methyltransferase
MGYKEFWGRRFIVDDRVLVPRPDTETLVEASLRLAASLGGDRALRVHEACCGSGCVAVSLAADKPRWIVSASDISEGALEVARANAAALLEHDRPGGPLLFSKSDLLSSVFPPGDDGIARVPFDIVLANPPYVSSQETDELLSRGWSEPRLALDGGPDGLDLLRRLVPEAERAIVPGGVLLVEADISQAEAVAQLFRASRFIDVEAVRDLAGKPRVTSGRKPWTT